jgi:serine/threonine protein phosphatase 1
MDEAPPPFYPSLPPNLRVYAVGDVHGRADLLEKMLRKIEADHIGYTGETLIVMLGDYVDRGHQSRAVLDILQKGSYGRFKLHCLRGNHEDILLRFFKDHSVAPGWFHYGGLQTLRSYGISILNATQDFDDIFQLRRALDSAMPQSHKDFLESLPYMLQIGDYVFVHAGIHPDKPLDVQDPHHCMWIREPFLSSDKKLDFMVVHGHSIRMKPEVRANRIGIDTGAYATGHLTCLVLQGRDQRFISTQA